MGKIVINKWLVWPSAVAWAFCPFIFFKDKKYVTDKILNHERIHIKQQLELLIIPFYVLYILFFLANLVSLNPKPYRNIPFEKEAFSNEKDLEYLQKRKAYNWIKYF